MKFLFSSNMERNWSNAYELNTDHLQRGNDLMASHNTFNDVDVYKSLLNDSIYSHVEISSVCVHHNDFCHGLQVLYRCTHIDGGHTVIRTGPRNVYASGYYAYHGPSPTTMTQIDLDDGEYLRGIRLQQGDIVDGITLVTNTREVHCGGRGGVFYEEQMVSPMEDEYEIVAFSGSIHGVLARIGCYFAKRSRWNDVRDYVMLRWLLDEGRASVMDHYTDSMETDESRSVGYCRHLVQNASDDIFCKVLQFL